MATPGMNMNMIPHMRLVDWLDDLSIEEAQWFYEDFIRPLDPTLPSLNLRKFCDLIFQHCPILADFSEYHAAAYTEFLAYKTRVPVRGAIMLNEAMDSVVLVKGWKKGARWSFPRGKINKDEKDLDCAIREVDEETGFDLHRAGLVPADEDQAKFIDISMREQQMRLYVFRNVPMDTVFEPKTRKEISKIEWWKLSDLPTLKREKQLQQQGLELGEEGAKASSFYMVAPFLGQLRAWIKQQKKADKLKVRAAYPRHVIVEDEETAGEEIFQSDAAPEITDTNEGVGHFASLLGKLRSSNLDTPAPLQSMIAPTPGHNSNAADELKRLLSIGGAGGAGSAGLPPPPIVSASNIQPAEQIATMNPLLSLLRGAGQPSLAQPTGLQPPHTPFDQIQNVAPQATTPHHHHPQAPPSFANYPPPPQFPSMTSLQSSESFSMPGMNGQQVQAPSASSLPQPNLSGHKLALLNAFQSSGARPAQDPSKNLGYIPAGFVPSTVRPGGGKSALPSPEGALRGASFRRLSKIEPAPPKLPTIVPPVANHKDALLGLFKTGGFPSALSASQKNLMQPALAELAAQTTPHLEKTEENFPPLGLAVNTRNIAQPRSPSLTSATVTGPLNAPDFDTIQHSARPGGPREIPPPFEQTQTDGSSRLTAMLRQQSLGKEEPKVSPLHVHRARPGSSSSAAGGANLVKKPFQPTILKRPQQTPPESPMPTSSRSGPQILARPTGADAGEKRDALLALFSKPAQGLAINAAPSETETSPVSELAATETPPAAPKLNPEISLQSVMSPLSPLPSGPHVAPGLSAKGPIVPNMSNLRQFMGHSTQQSTKNGRVGPGSAASLSELAGFPTSPPIGSNTTTPVTASNAALTTGPRGSIAGLQQPPLRQNSIPTGQIPLSLAEKGRVGSLGSAIAGNTGSQTPITPVDKSFLLGYLESVAKGA